MGAHYVFMGPVDIYSIDRRVHIAVRLTTIAATTLTSNVDLSDFMQSVNTLGISLSCHFLGQMATGAQMHVPSVTTFLC